MRPNRLYRVTLTLILLWSLVETAAAQAGQTRSDPIGSNQEKIVVTLRAAADAPTDELHRATLTLVSLLSSAETAAAQGGQGTSDAVDNRQEKIVVTVRAGDTTGEESYRVTLTLASLSSLAQTAAAQAGQTGSDPVDNSEERGAVTAWTAPNTPTEQHLSQDFAAAGLRATILLREWQQSIASTIRMGLPLCESCIALDRDQAADAVQMTTLLASTDAERTTLQELLNLFGNIQRWSDALVEDNRNGALGPYYMSATALTDDPLFQQSAECARFLAPMLASGQLAEDPSCQ
jgi:hypothetical protein